MAGIGVFVVLNIILQLSPAHYSLVSQAVSDLAVGRYGWAMDTGFFLCGASIVAHACTGPARRGSRGGFEHGDCALPYHGGVTGERRRGPAGRT